MKKSLLFLEPDRKQSKCAPLVQELKTVPQLQTVVCLTGQHKQMLDQLLQVFGVVPDYDLAIMKDGQTLFDITSAVLCRMKDILDRETGYRVGLR